MDENKAKPIMMKVSVDTTELDLVIEKVHILTEKLKEANALLQELTSKESLIEINVKL